MNFCLLSNNLIREKYIKLIIFQTNFDYNILQNFQSIIIRDFFQNLNNENNNDDNDDNLEIESYFFAIFFSRTILIDFICFYYYIN